MSDEHRIEKVTAFVVSESSPTKLLVFEHPTAGVQLPAGTIEIGETPEEAERREVFEETGIQLYDQPILLGKDMMELPPQKAVMMKNIPATAHSGAGGVLHRGHYVEILESSGDRVLVRGEVMDAAADPPQRLGETDCWTIRQNLSTWLHRYYFYSTAEIESERWEHEADGHVFNVLWATMDERLRLVGPQQVWLDTYHDTLFLAKT